MIKIDEFKNLVTSNADGTKRTELAVMPITVGDTLKITNIEPRDVNGTPFAAAISSDGNFISANALLRRGNGINFQTTNLEQAAEKLYNAVKAAGGLTLKVAKVYRSESASGYKRNNYCFEPKEL